MATCVIPCLSLSAESFCFAGPVSSIRMMNLRDISPHNGAFASVDESQFRPVNSANPEASCPIASRWCKVLPQRRTRSSTFTTWHVSHNTWP
jgi:hypothetical protein